MVDDPKDHTDTEILPTLTALLREAEARFPSIQHEYLNTKRTIDTLRRAIRELQQVSTPDPTEPPVSAGGPAQRARAYLREMGKPCLIEEVIDHIQQQTAHYQLMDQARAYIERSINRTCTGGTILYFKGERIGLPVHASDPQWEDQVDWEKIKSKGFTPHNKQKDHLKTLFPPEILKKLLSTSK